MLQRRPGVTRVVDPVRDAPARSRARSPTCGSSPFTTRTVSAGGRASACATARRCARAPRSGRAGRGRGCRADRARPDAPHDLRQRALVDLEQPELGVALRQERRGDAGDQICAGAVPGELAPRLEDLRGHRRRGRLPVRGGDDGRALGSRAASASIAPGSSFHRSFPGSVVPPPAPARRDIRAAARAAKVSTARRALKSRRSVAAASLDRGNLRGRDPKGGGTPPFRRIRSTR